MATLTRKRKGDVIVQQDATVRETQALQKYELNANRSD
jgi:hypothetical protein